MNRIAYTAPALGAAFAAACMARGNFGKIAAGLEFRDEETAPSVIEVRKAVDGLQKVWADYRAENDARLKAIETKGAADPLDVEKLGKMDGALTELQTRLDSMEARLKRAGTPKDGAEIPGANPEYREEFRTFLRNGRAGQLMEKRAMTAQDNTEGGYLTSPELDATVSRLARDFSPARNIFTVKSIGSNAYKKPLSKSNANTGWVGETGSRPQTDPSDLAEINIICHEIYANIGVTQTLLDDGFVNIEQHIAEEAMMAFDDGETAAFFTGNGVNKPRGLLDLTVTVETGSTRAAQGSVGVVKTGSATTLGSSEFDPFLDVVSRLRARYRQNARWLWNALTESPIRKVKDANNNYMWQPSNQVGTPATFFGFPVSVCEHMPNIADGALPIAFGDFRQAYYIIDRVGMRTLRDPYTAKPYVLFYITKRVGGGHHITEAFKAVQTAA